MPAVKRFPVRKIQELLPAVNDCLVEIETGSFQDIQQFQRAFCGITIGRLPFRMLRVFDSAGQQVDRFIAVAAGNGDRVAVAVAKRLKQIRCEVS